MLRMLWDKRCIFALNDRLAIQCHACEYQGRMLNFTPLVRPVFESRIRQSQRFIDFGDVVQREQLQELIGQASFTEVGLKYKFADGLSYKQFSERVPLHDYEDLRPQIMRMVNGEANVLWRGTVMNFAQSSV